MHNNIVIHWTSRYSTRGIEFGEDVVGSRILVIHRKWDFNNNFVIVILIYELLM